MGWVVNATTLPLYPREGAPVPIVYKMLSRPQYRSKLVWRRENLFASRGFEPRIVQTVESRCTFYAVPVRKYLVSLYCQELE